MTETMTTASMFITHLRVLWKYFHYCLNFLNIPDISGPEISGILFLMEKIRISAVSTACPVQCFSSVVKCHPRSAFASLDIDSDANPPKHHYRSCKGNKRKVQIFIWISRASPALLKWSVSWHILSLIGNCL